MVSVFGGIAACAAPPLSMARCSLPQTCPGSFEDVSAATQLQHLFMGGTAVTPASLLQVQSLPSLCSLGIQSCEGIQELPDEAPPTLRHVNVSSLQFVPEHRLAAWLRPVFPQLLTLQAAESQLTLGGLQALAEGGGATIMGASTSTTAAASSGASVWITDSKHHGNSEQGGLSLRQVDLSWCEQMEEVSLAPFLRCLPQLEHLTLRTQFFSDDVCAVLAEACPQLRHLTVARAGGPGATNEGMEQLGRGCSKLRYLNVSWNNGVSDAGVCAVLRHCPQLGHLVLEGVKQLTDAGILQALRAAPRDSLRVLDLSWVNTCDEALVRQIQREHPYVEVLDYYTNTHKAPKRVPAMVLVQPYAKPLAARA